LRVRTAGLGLVCRNTRGEGWTNNALRLAVRRLCVSVGLDGADGLERITAYTIRHTAATAATAAGVRDRVLADLLGHTQTRTTARYQHLTVDHLRAAVETITFSSASSVAS